MCRDSSEKSGEEVLDISILLIIKLSESFSTINFLIISFF